MVKLIERVCLTLIHLLWVAGQGDTGLLLISSM